MRFTFNNQMIVHKIIYVFFKIIFIIKRKINYIFI